MCNIHKKTYGDRAQTCYPPYNFTNSGKLLTRQHSTTMYAGGVTKSRLLHIQNVSIGLKLLVDSWAQISLLPATNSDRLRGSDKLTLQAVKKSIIKTYS